MSTVLEDEDAAPLAPASVFFGGLPNPKPTGFPILPVPAGLPKPPKPPNDAGFGGGDDEKVDLSKPNALDEELELPKALDPPNPKLAGDVLFSGVPKGFDAPNTEELPNVPNALVDEVAFSVLVLGVEVPPSAKGDGDGALPPAVPNGLGVLEGAPNGEAELEGSANGFADVFKPVGGTANENPDEVVAGGVTAGEKENPDAGVEEEEVGLNWKPPPVLLLSELNEDVEVLG